MTLRLQDIEDSHSPYWWVKPLPSELLKALSLDYEFVSATGNELTSKSGMKVYDFAGGFGSCLLGHNHPEILKTAVDSLNESVPVHAQLSLRNEAGRLAQALSAEASKSTGKQYITTFGNSGAEAVEAAIKLALFNSRQSVEAHLKKVELKLSALRSRPATEWKLPDGWASQSLSSFIAQIRQHNLKSVESNPFKIVAIDRAFHGKTTGALSLTHNPAFRKSFFGDESDSHFVPANNLQILEQIVEDSSFNLVIPNIRGSEVEIIEQPVIGVSAIFVEPVQGEGGIHVLDEEYLRELRKIADEKGVLLVFDEIQCGFYRTGQLFSSSVAADVHLLGKQLGGGLAKISAMMTQQTIYPKEFGLLHTSTFAEDEFSSRIGLKALELSKRHSDEVLKKGEVLKEKLIQLQSKFPEIIVEVRGKGLMLGIEFKSFAMSQNYTLQFMARTGYFNYILSSFLLNNFQVRVAAPLSASQVLRIQPSVFIDDESINKLISGLERLCETLHCEDALFLVRHLLKSDPESFRESPGDFRQGEIATAQSPAVKNKVGFISHFISPDTMKVSDPSMSELSDESIHDLLERFLPVAKPIFAGSQVVKNLQGDEVEVYIAGCCFTSQMAKKSLKNGTTYGFTKLVQDAVDFLNDEHGVTFAGLGQYTSILSRNGQLISNSKMAITSGNSFTAHLGLEATLNACSEKGIEISQERIAVIGAGGNIASVYADCFSRYTKNLHLVGSEGDGSLKRLEHTAETIVRNSFERFQKGNEPEGVMDQFLFQTTLFKTASKDDDLNLFRALGEELGDRCPIRLTTDLNDLKDCKIALAATNADSAFLKPSHFPSGAVICDIAVPLNSTEELLSNSKNIKVIQGGIASLPGNESLVARGFPLPRGMTFGCLAEALILGFEDLDINFSYGPITPERVRQIGALGKKNGISLYKSKHVSAL